MSTITINDVAALAGVSIGTVSNVINRKGVTSAKTEAKVMAAIKELNYIPNSIAQDLKTNRNKTIGIIAEDIGAFMSGRIVDGISAVCESSDYAVSLFNLRTERRIEQHHGISYNELVKSPDFQRAVEISVNNLLSARISGLIYVGIFPRDVEGILPELDIPVVYVYCFTKRDDDYCVNYDDYQGAKLAVDHLVAAGHKKIALISGPIDSIPTHKRMRGYTESLMEHGLVFDPAYIRVGSWRFEDGYDECNRLMALPEPPTAIFCMSDVMAYGAIKAAHESGIAIPNDLAVHGFDNLQMSQYFFPSLTTVDIPLSMLGEESAKMLLTVLSGKDIAQRQILLPCYHILRQSAGKAAL